MSTIGVVEFDDSGRAIASAKNDSGAVQSLRAEDTGALKVRGPGGNTTTDEQIAYEEYIPVGGSASFLAVTGEARVGMVHVAASADAVVNVYDGISNAGTKIDVIQCAAKANGTGLRNFKVYAGLYLELASGTAFMSTCYKPV